jgi:hypothetical protein
MFLKPDERRTKELGEAVVSALQGATSAIDALRQHLIKENERRIARSDVSTRESRVPEGVDSLGNIANHLNALKEQYEADREPNQEFRNRSLFVQWGLALITFFAFLAAAYYACIARLQKDTMNGTLTEIRVQTGYARDSAKAAQDAVAQARGQFRLDQRPYIWLMNNIGSPEFIPSPTNLGMGKVLWTWHFTDYGKRPAQDIRYFSFLRLGDGEFLPSRGSTGPSLAPPLPPNKDDFGSAVSDLITRREWERLTARTNTGNTIALRVRYEYTDGNTDSKYETSICISRLNTGAIAYCRDNKYIH